MAKLNLPYGSKPCCNEPKREFCSDWKDETSRCTNCGSYINYGSSRFWKRFNRIKGKLTTVKSLGRIFEWWNLTRIVKIESKTKKVLYWDWKSLAEYLNSH